MPARWIDRIRSRVAREGDDPMRTTWTRWYLRKRSQGKESLSGSGSDLEATEGIREALPGLIQELGVRTLLDAPCGDLFWLRTLDLGLEHYIGVDVVPALIDANRRQFGDRGWEFEALDLTAQVPPQADMILCRDCLVHLSFDDAKRALANFKRSGAQYLLTTTFPDTRDNFDIETGRWRPLNLEAAPFGFPPPERLIDEGPHEPSDRVGKCLALWALASLPV